MLILAAKSNIPTKMMVKPPPGINDVNIPA
jgi:hypothetical protein